MVKMAHVYCSGFRSVRGGLLGPVVAARTLLAAELRSTALYADPQKGHSRRTFRCRLFLKETSHKQARRLQLGNEVKGEARWIFRTLLSGVLRWIRLG